MHPRRRPPRERSQHFFLGKKVVGIDHPCCGRARSAGINPDDSLYAADQFQLQLVRARALGVFLVKDWCPLMFMGVHRVQVYTVQPASLLLR